MHQQITKRFIVILWILVSVHRMLVCWCFRKFPKGVQKVTAIQIPFGFFCASLGPFSILSRFRFKRYKAGCGFPRYFIFFSPVPSSISSVSWWGWLSSSFTATSLYRRYTAFCRCKKSIFIILTDAIFVQILFKKIFIHKLPDCSPSALFLLCILPYVSLFSP